jgi:two-component sensor histidine kinase
VSGGRVAFSDDAKLPRLENGIENHGWFDLTFSPLVDDGGGHCGLLVVAIDVSDRKAVEGEQLYLARDVQYRVRNILAVVRSMVSRTEERSFSVEDFGVNVKSRIDALARVQSVLMRTAHRDASLAEIALAELRSQGGSDDQIATRGPPVLLPAKAAETLGLVFHELAANAAKFGALSARRGVVTIDWRLDRSVRPTTLSIDWTETGIAAIGRAPRRDGFGWSLIKESIPYELRGTVDLGFSNGAFHCHICVPLIGRRSDLPAGHGRTSGRLDAN